MTDAEDLRYAAGILSDEGHDGESKRVEEIATVLESANARITELATVLESANARITELEDAIQIVCGPRK